ncbi:hypothetical protein HFD88_001283 [Aspergillus terreus]|nr:hypothetical protein HFD88_001283 [Aspergillus terreus]
MAPRTRSLIPFDFSGARRIFENILKELDAASEFKELIYENIADEDWLSLSESLANHPEVERRHPRVNYNAETRVLRIKIMPTELHDVHQRWVNNVICDWRAAGLITLQENRLICMGVGTTFKGFTGLYQGSEKEPDLFLRPDSSTFPTVVIESGWSESFPYLRSDKDLWMRGCPTVNVVILLKWSELSEKRVKGTAEIWTRDAAGNLQSREMKIFPSPNTPGNEDIDLTKGQLFGQWILPFQNAADILPLDVGLLRDFATEVSTNLMGLQPI